jgi:hypothetical protein
MQIYIVRDGQRFEPLEENAVLEMIRKGQLSRNDSAIGQGQHEWQTLGAMFPDMFQTPAATPLFGSQEAPVLSASQMNKPRMRKRFIGGIYVASVLLLVLGLVIGGVMGLASADIMPEGLLVGGATIASAAYLQFLVVHIIVMFYILFKMWDSIQDGVSTSTGKAIGFLFIPIFSIYWIFKAWGGFPAEYNAFIERHQLNVPRLVSPVYTLVPIFTLLSGLLVLPVVAVPFIFMAVISQTSDAVNNLYAGLQNKQAGSNLMVETGKETLLSPIMRNAVFGLAGILVIAVIGLAGMAWWNLNPKPGKDDLPETVGNFSKTQDLMNQGSFLGLRKQFGALYESADKKKAIVYDVKNATYESEKKVYQSSGATKRDITDSNGKKVGEFIFSGGSLEIYNGSKRMLIWDLNLATPTYILPYAMKKEGKISSLTEAEMLDFAKALPVNSQLNF